MRLSLLLADGDDAPLLLEVARQADRCGIAALWLPSPHPAVAAAAVAVATRRIGVRACLALPLHNAIRVAEEWSLVDNLSHGRVGLAFGTSDDRGEIGTVRQLWRGEAAHVSDGEGRPIDIRILPQPVQRELPFWRILTEPEAGRTAGIAGSVTGTVPAFSSVEDGLRALRPWDSIGVEEVACRVDLADALDAIEILEAIHHGG